MAVSTIVARVDADDKKNFNAFCDAVGLNASIAVNIFIKTVLRENRIPFSISGKSYDTHIHSDTIHNEAHHD